MKSLFYIFGLLLTINMTYGFVFEAEFTDLGDSPILDSGSLVNLKVYNPAKDCLLFEENHPVDLSLSDGKVSLELGNGSQVSLDANYSNPSEVLLNNIQASCGYNPGPADNRILEVSFNDGVNGLELMGDVNINPTPQATYASESGTAKSLVLNNGGFSTAFATQATANYSLDFPANSGAAGDVLTTDGTGLLSWAAVGVTSFNGRSGVVAPTTGDYTWAQINKTSSILSEIADIDAPAGDGSDTGKVLKWNNATSRWEVGDDINGGGAGSVSSTEIADGAIVDADINSAAAIAQSKIANLTTDLAAKQPIITPGTVAQYLRGDLSFATLQDDVKGTLLLGFSSGAGTVVATDTILQAVQKLDGNITTNAAAISGLDTDDVSEATNLFFTDVRAKTAAVVNSTAGVEVDQAPSVNAMKTYVAANALADNSVTAQKLSSMGATPGQVLEFSGSSWIPVNPSVGAGDISNGGNSSGAPVDIGTNDAFPLIFRTSSTEAMRIEMSGYVGVGIMTPNAKLDVDGTLKVADGGEGCTTTIEKGMIRYNVGNNNFEFCDGVNWRRALLDGGSTGPALTIGTSNPQPLNLKTNNTTVMTLTDGGNVGIGTNTPTDKLHVLGNLRVVGVTDCTLGNGAGSTNCTSDERLKEDITPIANALDKIKSVKGVDFVWNDLAVSPGRNDIGVIAQDIQRVFPTAVIENSEGYLSVDYAVLVSPLIESVKELDRNQEMFNRMHEGNTVDNAREIASLKKINKEIMQENQEIKEALCTISPTLSLCRKR